MSGEPDYSIDMTGVVGSRVDLVNVSKIGSSLYWCSGKTGLNSDAVAIGPVVVGGDGTPTALFDPDGRAVLSGDAERSMLDALAVFVNEGRGR